MKHISYEDSILEVHFNRVFSTSEKYFVELRKNNEPIACFDMKQDRMDRWVIVQPAPSWVNAIVSELTRVITG